MTTRYPLQAAGPYLLPGAAAALAFAARMLSADTFVLLACSSLACASLRVALASVRVGLANESIDLWIATGAGSPPSDEALQRRRRELVTGRTRIRLASLVRRVARDAETRGRALTPAQANRRRLRRHVRDLDRIADLLADCGVMVSPRAVALAEVLVTSAGGPLYAPARAGELPMALARILAALREGERPAA